MATKEAAVGPGGAPVRKMKKNYDLKTAFQIWIGRPKIGKTSTAAAIAEAAEEYKLPLNPFFLIFEPGTGGVELTGTTAPCVACKGTGLSGKKKKCAECSGDGVIRQVIPDLDTTEKWIEWAAKSDYNPIVFDTCDAYYRTVMAGVCAELNLDSPYGANDHGLSWSIIRDRVRNHMGQLIGAGKGVILLMHVYAQRKRTKSGEMEVQTFNIPGSSRQDLAALSNQILYFDCVPNPDGEGDIRVLYAQPQAGIEAGDHWGLFPAELKLGNSAKEAAEAILTCFKYLE